MHPNRHRRTIRLICLRSLICLSILSGLLVNACTNQAKLDADAGQKIKLAVIADAQAAAKADPSLKPAVDTLVNGWDSRSEPSNRALAGPILADFGRLFPNEADSVGHLLHAWDQRLSELTAAHP